MSWECDLRSRIAPTLMSPFGDIETILKAGRMVRVGSRPPFAFEIRWSTSSGLVTHKRDDRLELIPILN